MLAAVGSLGVTQAEVKSVEMVSMTVTLHMYEILMILYMCSPHMWSGVWYLWAHTPDL